MWTPSELARWIRQALPGRSPSELLEAVERPEGMSRRNFLKACGATTVAASAAGLILPARAIATTGIDPATGDSWSRLVAVGAYELEPTGFDSGTPYELGAAWPDEAMPQHLLSSKHTGISDPGMSREIDMLRRYNEAIAFTYAVPFRFLARPGTPLKVGSDGLWSPAQAGETVHGHLLSREGNGVGLVATRGSAVRPEG